MLAKLESMLPVGPAWRYEPELDGFRGLVWHAIDEHVRLLSRNARDLAPWFPELTRAAKSLPPRTLLDGEIVIGDERGYPDFAALQHRLAVARKHTEQAAAAHPAVLVAFDLLELAATDLTRQELDRRRMQLEGVLSAQRPCLQLVLQTADVELARDWLRFLPSIEGVVAKRGDGRYESGRLRDWVKVKRYRTVDCVVIGVTGDSAAPGLVLGLRHSDDMIHHLGLCRPVPPAMAAPILALLEQAGPLERPIPSRWQQDAVPPWRRVPTELVCEIRAGNLDRGRWLRQPATFLRWRPDRSPSDCGLEQLKTM